MTTAEFIDEPITVNYDSDLLRPISFTWRSGHYQIAEVLKAWQDWRMPASSRHARGWRHRRHRDYYEVRTTDGQVFLLYLDRAGGRRVWVLLKRLAIGADEHGDKGAEKR